LAKIFYETEMDKGITIAVQSMNPDTLKAVKRKNVDSGKLREFLQMYNQEDLPSYMELILGLPEETLNSFVDGICQIIDLEQHNYIGIYPLTALPNTPFGEPEYISKYGLKVIETFTAFNHFDVTEQNEYEREHMVVASNTMTHEEYKECHIWRWLFMFGHYLGTLQFISRFLNKSYGISYRDFYGNLYDFMIKNPDTFLGKEMKKTRESVDNVMSAVAPWGRVVDEVRPNFAWDFEEATVITSMKNKEKFYNEVAQHIQTCYNINNELLKSLIKYQDFSILDPSRTYPIKENFDYNIHDVIYNGEELKNETQNITFKAKNYNGDYFNWGKEILWWGRRVASCKVKTEVYSV
jgi:putative methyltransferase